MLETVFDGFAFYEEALKRLRKNNEGHFSRLRGIQTSSLSGERIVAHPEILSEASVNEAVTLGQKYVEQALNIFTFATHPRHHPELILLRCDLHNSWEERQDVLAGQLRKRIQELESVLTTSVKLDKASLTDGRFCAEAYHSLGNMQYRLYKLTRDATVLEEGIRYLEMYVLIAGTPRSALDRETLMRALYELGWLNSKWSHPWSKPKAITAFSGFLKMLSR
jgi:hypothetical protein